MEHRLNKMERAYGFIFNERIFNYETDHIFEGVQVEYTDGTIRSYYGHKKGSYHTHSTIIGRMDGLTDAFEYLDSDLIDVKIDQNVVFIRECV